MKKIKNVRKEEEEDFFHEIERRWKRTKDTIMKKGMEGRARGENQRSEMKEIRLE